MSEHDNFGWESFSDVLYQIYGTTFDEIQTMKIFETLPANVKAIANEWTLADTDFRNLAYEFLLDNKGEKHD